MDLQQRQRQETKLILTHTMRQSLAVLSMPITELQEYVENAILDNPLLEIGEGQSSSNEEDCDITIKSCCESEGYLVDWCSDFQGVIGDVTGFLSEETFTEMLIEQLLQITGKEACLLPICYYLIYCLDDKGYLRFNLDELAIEQKIPLKQMNKALAIVQGLQPSGVGARSLKECLLLQAQQKKLGSEVVLLLEEGLEFLSKKDYKAIETLLGCSRKRVEYLVKVVCNLNPIPSQGYKTESLIDYQVPEAEIKVENDSIVIEVNADFVPRLQINKSTEKLLQQSDENNNNHKYLKGESDKAQSLLSSLHKREKTIYALLTAIVKKQACFFLRGKALVPVTMSQMAQELGVSNSTISRAVQGKTVIFRGQVIALKDLFVVGIVHNEGVVSTNGIKQNLKQLIVSEDSTHPLSDEALSVILSANRLTVSRRTVAKYREIMGIGTSGERKRQKNNK